MRLCVAAAFVALALHSNYVSVKAEIFRLHELKTPGNWTLNTAYFFYVYNHGESPDSKGEAFVKFEGLSFKSTSPRKTDDMMKDYRSLQLSIIRLEHFWDVINPQDFCCTATDVNVKRCEMENQIRFRRSAMKGPMDEVDVYPYTVKHHAATQTGDDDLKKNIRTTGVYVLVISNCGELNRATVTGNVIVKNPFGFLPGNEYHKLPFYGWLCLWYIFLGVLWALLCLRFWNELFNIQNCVAVVITFGLVESFVWYLVFYNWNETGERNGLLFVLGNLFSVSKSIFSYMLVLVASMGWGVNRPYLDKTDVQRIQLCCFLFIILDFARRVVTSFRHSRQLPVVFILLCLVPMSLLNGGIFYWVVNSLTNLIETLKNRRQSDKLQLFENLFRVLMVTLVVATTSQLYEFWNISRSIEAFWKTQWFFSDGVSHILFVLVLMAMMYLWAPHKNSQRYAYSAQLDTDDAEMAKVGAVTGGAEEDLDDGVDPMDDESFWANTKKATKKGGSAPAAIGKVASDNDVVAPVPVGTGEPRLL